VIDPATIHMPQFFRRILESVSEDSRHLISTASPITVLCATQGNTLMGQVLLERRLNAERYLQFLNDTLEPYMHVKPLAVPRRLYVQQDEAPPHSAGEVRNWLMDWAWGTNWTLRSPDLTPEDFFCGVI
jgi:hypothetical protein